MRNVRLLAALVCLALSTLASAAPMLSLVKSGTPSTTSDSIPLGTATYNLDLRANTDNNPIGGLQFFIQTAPADAVNYGSAPVTPLNAPFTSADLASSPANGASVRQNGGRTAFFTFNPDYAAFSDNALARYQFDTSSLTQGTYVFTPVGEELTNASATITSFATPGPFTLSVVPEPAALTLAGMAGTLLLLRRRQSA